MSYLNKTTVGGKYGTGNYNQKGVLCWKITPGLGAKPIKSFKRDILTRLEKSKL